MKFQNYKLLFWIAISIAFIEGLIITTSTNLTKRITPDSYLFSDSVDGLVSAEGAWVSTHKVAFPLSSASIECWQNFGHCWVASGTIMNFDNDNIFNKLFSKRYLAVDLDLHEIEIWNDDVIETKPSTSIDRCTQENYRFDRRNKTVTYSRKTLSTTDFCTGSYEEPIVSKLGDGVERLKIQNNLR